MLRYVTVSQGEKEIPSAHNEVTYVVCLKSTVNGTRKQTKQKTQTN
jgi:hypothetical protein